jgi:hypothetical protein
LETSSGPVSQWVFPAWEAGCQVSHDGPAEQDETRPDPAAWQREQAHGLRIIDQVADTVTLDHDPCGTTVTANFAVSSLG